MLLFAVLPGLPAQDDAPTFRSDIRLVRVDTQVVDQSNKAITVLQAKDFRLTENGRVRQIKNFLAEDMPVDVLLLLDVSGSMRPNIELVERASNEALRVLAPADRVAIMTFDRGTKVKLPFRENKREVQNALANLIERERFNGGTDIFRGMVDAIEYVQKNARQDARRAIVIVTDDRTGGHRDDDAIISALSEADTVLSALLAPDAMRNIYGTPGGGRRPGGVYIPSLPGLGGIIIGGGGSRYPGGGGGYPGGVDRQTSGGTPEIAEGSGGDSMNVGSAYAFRETLERIRQRYALHFNLPPTARASEVRRVTVELTEAARRRYPDAQVRYRRTYRTPSNIPPPQPGAQDEEEVITQSIEQTPEPVAVETVRTQPASRSTSGTSSGTWRSNRTVIDETERVRGPLPAMREPAKPATPTSGTQTPAPAATGTTKAAESAPKPVWRPATEADKTEAEEAAKTASTPKKKD
jgi:VWFA-related protein